MRRVKADALVGFGLGVIVEVMLGHVVALSQLGPNTLAALLVLSLNTRVVHSRLNQQSRTPELLSDRDAVFFVFHFSSIPPPPRFRGWPHDASFSGQPCVCAVFTEQHQQSPQQAVRQLARGTPGPSCLLVERHFDHRGRAADRGRRLCPVSELHGRRRTHAPVCRMSQPGPSLLLANV